MILYVAIWKDRHCDTDVKVFSDREQARSWAAATVREYDRFNDLDETINAAMERSGVIYYGRYSCEGDSITVVARELDAH